MEMYVINTSESAQDFIEYVKEMPTVVPRVKGNVIEFNGDQFEVEDRYKYILRRFNKVVENVSNVVNNAPVNNTNPIDDLIYGKDNTQHVVAMEVVGEEMWLFKNDGSIEKRPNEYWIIASRPIGSDTEKLEGNLAFKYKKTFTDAELYNKSKSILYGKRVPTYSIYDPAEAFMIMNGVTFFKGLKVADVSVLSFDIESSGVVHNDKSKVLLISNTFRSRSGKVIRKLFSLEDYDEDDVVMINDWCNWVREIDPSIVIGHNIFGFDLPYLSFCYSRGSNEDLELGKDCSSIRYSKKPKKFRKDGSQSYDYHEAKIFGRQIIDTWMLAIKADFARKYESYGLKQIIEQEGLEKKDRTKWDFSDILPRDIWKRYKNGDVAMWQDFKKYCIEDSDDALKLYDLMIPQYFYYMQSLPMPFQTMNLTATGRQINGFLCRSYLQQGHSIPEAGEKESYGGGISFGNPGIYDHVYKVDVASLYPSIMITEEIYDRNKDPKGHFLTMVKHFTAERLRNKKIGNDTGDRYYKDLEQAQKIVINSAYGLLGTGGLNFNSMSNADKVTEKGREILTTGIKWAEDKGFKIVNVDTDSFSYTTGKKLAEVTERQAKKLGTQPSSEFMDHITELNSLYRDGIIWEDDGYFKKFIVVKAKNYILFDGKKVKIKGSGLKGTNKEKALTEFVNNVIMLMLNNRRDAIFEQYRNMALDIKNNWNPQDWSMKKTVTKSVLNPERAQEQKVLDAIQDIDYQEGDKVYLYSVDKETLKLREDFEGTYHIETYYKKLYNTLCVFETLVDTSLFPDYSLSRNKTLI